MSPSRTPLRYTTRQAIALRLEKRLQVGGSAQNTLGKQLVDDNLIDQVARQVESRVTQALGILYALPLKLTDPDTCNAISSVVEKLVLAELLPVHIIAETGREGGLRQLMAAEGARELELLSSGTVELLGEFIQETSDRVVRQTTNVGVRGTRTERSPQGKVTRHKPRQRRAEEIRFGEAPGRRYGNRGNDGFGGGYGGGGNAWFGGDSAEDEPW